MNKISVIIPAYNCEKTIERAINSVLNQEYSNIEVIVVNDGSKDNTLKKCEDIAKSDERVKIISTNNIGVSGARNLGIENAKGEYITFLDADDYIDTDAYKDCMNIIKKENVDIVRFSYIKDYGNVKKERKYISPVNKKINKNDYDEEIYSNVFCSEDYTSIWNAVIKKCIIDNTRFNTNLMYAEDFLFMMETIFNSSSIYITDKPYYHYVVSSGSVTLNYTKSNIINRIDNILVSNTKVLNMLENKSKYLKKYDEKIQKSFDDKLGMVANNESYRTFKEITESIEKLESYKSYITLVGRNNINKSYIEYLKCKITKKTKFVLKKILIKGA